MKHLIQAAAIALAVAGSAIATVSVATPASAADISVTFDPGTVRYGYNDGYWDRSRAWHPWAQPAHREAYRAYKGAECYDYAHTRDADQGWREKH